ncbi:transketolase [Dysosmobacter sp.]
MTSEQLAWKIRRHGIEMTHLSGGSHIGAVLSVADIVAVLYTEVLRVVPQEPDWPDRDRFILSKGHAGAAVYAALAERGFFPVEELKTHYQNGSKLSGHVSHHLPGVDFSTGSLGHGLSAGAGMALTARQNGRPYRTFVVLGDGECNEGSVWEAAQFAAYFQLDNLVAVVDHNQMQSLDRCDKTLSSVPLADTWRGFGWNVLEADGNDHDSLRAAFAAVPKNAKPTVLVAKTVKGKGISFMEMDILWHYRFPHEGWEYDCAVRELWEKRPAGVEDPYTPRGIPSPALPDEKADIGHDHTLSATYHPTWRLPEEKA